MRVVVHKDVDMVFVMEWFEKIYILKICLTPHLYISFTSYKCFNPLYETIIKKFNLPSLLHNTDVKNYPKDNSSSVVPFFFSLIFLGTNLP